MKFPFSALIGAIKRGSPLLVNKLLAAGVRPLPLVSLPPEDRGNKPCCLQALAELHDLTASIEQKLTAEELAVCSQVIIAVVSHLPENFDFKHLVIQRIIIRKPKVIGQAVKSAVEARASALRK